MIISTITYGIFKAVYESLSPGEKVFPLLIFIWLRGQMRTEHVKKQNNVL